jgi:hypothetical protein
MFGLPISSDVRSYPDIGEGLGEVIATHGNLASRGAGVFIAGQIAGAVAAALFGLLHISQLYALVSLAKLRDDGIISSEEFDAKRAELLSRL